MPKPRRSINAQELVQILQNEGTKKVYLASDPEGNHYSLLMEVIDHECIPGAIVLGPSYEIIDAGDLYC